MHDLKGPFQLANALDLGNGSQELQLVSQRQENANDLEQARAIELAQHSLSVRKLGKTSR